MNSYSNLTGHRKKIIYAGGAAIAFIAIFTVASLPSFKTASVELSPETAVVLAEEGFRPARITIMQGQTLTFKTIRNQPFWPASNLHPTHEFYPEFDPRRVIQTNEEWGFHFDKPGVWEYHDHINPRYTGIVIVLARNAEGTSGASVTIPKVPDCNQYDSRTKEGQGNLLTCWDNFFRIKTRQAGVQTALDTFQEIYDADPFFRVHCHRQDHYLGEEAYWKLAEERKLDKKLNLPSSIDLCGNGFWHGFMQEFASHDKNYGVDGAVAFCETNATNGKSLQQCYHGIGHGLTYLHAGRLWQKDEVKKIVQTIIDAGVRDCEIIGKNVYSCTFGVMGGVENFYWGQHGFKMEITKEDPFWLCEQQSRNDLKKACYSVFMPILYSVLNRDTRAMLGIIQEKISDAEYLSLAAERAGEIFNKFETQVGQDDFSEFIRLCRTIAPPFHLRCLRGFAHGFIKDERPETIPFASKTLCASPLLSAEERDSCFQGIIEMLSYSFPDLDALKLCQDVGREYIESCVTRIKGVNYGQ